MDKLVFATAGMPLSTEPRKYENALQQLVDLNLGGMEMEFVRGVRMNPKTIENVNKISKELDLTLTAHGPYYINLNSKEEDKIEASKVRILDTARVSHACGAYSITFHAAYYMGKGKEFVYNKVKEGLAEITQTLKEENIDIWIRPETTGKATQWGDLDEVIEMSKEFDMVLPCVDFSHLHARSIGEYNTYEEFCEIFEKIKNGLGRAALDNFHAHIAGIEYGEKGEKRHLPLLESDMNYKDLMKAFKKFDVKGIIICESPNIEEDAILLRDTYLAL